MEVKMIRVGLTGGIAAGKSVVSRRLTELGIPVVDYDQLARQVVEPGTPGLAAVVREFGEQVLGPDGRLDRLALARRVFGGDDEALDRLEEIIHPLVIAMGGDLDLEAERHGEAMIVHSVPLLVEVAGPEAFDTVLVVDALPEVRVERMVAGRGMTEEEAWGRIDAQTDDEVRRAAADVVFDGSGSDDNLRRQVDDWVEATRRGFAYRPSPERAKFLVAEDGLT
jgi:dephospho-CoA kinase